ncbi:unnamed protein product, partial [Timema podura]|nr:unnamed protein product [Timema podura]
IEVACRERGSALDVLVENNKQDYVFNFNKAYPMNYKGVGDNCENLGDEQTAMLPCQRMEAPLSQYPVSIFYQFYILFKRSLICTLRDSTCLVASAINVKEPLGGEGGSLTGSLYRLVLRKLKSSNFYRVTVDGAICWCGVDLLRSITHLTDTESVDGT